MKQPHDNPELVTIATGMVMERDMFEVVAEIQRKWPRLRVQFLDPERAEGLTDAPYQIIDTDNLGRDYIVMNVWQLDSSVIHRLEMSDNSQRDVQAAMEKENAKIRKAQNDTWKESMADAHEKFHAVTSSDKDTYVLTDGDKKITIRSNGDNVVERNQGAGS